MTVLNFCDQVIKNVNDMKHIFDLKVLQYKFSTLCFNECDEVMNNIDKMKHIFDLQVLQYEMNKVYLEIKNLSHNIDSIKMSTNKWIEHVKDFAKKTLCFIWLCNFYARM